MKKLFAILAAVFLTATLSAQFITAPIKLIDGSGNRTDINPFGVGNNVYWGTNGAGVVGFYPLTCGVPAADGNGIYSGTGVIPCGTVGTLNGTGCLILRSTAGATNLNLFIGQDSVGLWADDGVNDSHVAILDTEWIDITTSVRCGASIVTSPGINICTGLATSNDALCGVATTGDINIKAGTPSGGACNIFGTINIGECGVDNVFIEGLAYPPAVPTGQGGIYSGSGALPCAGSTVTMGGQCLMFCGAGNIAACSISNFTVNACGNVDLTGSSQAKLFTGCASAGLASGCGGVAFSVENPISVSILQASISCVASPSVNDITITAGDATSNDCLAGVATAGDISITAGTASGGLTNTHGKVTITGGDGSCMTVGASIINDTDTYTAHWTGGAGTITLGDANDNVNLLGNVQVNCAPPLTSFNELDPVFGAMDTLTELNTQISDATLIDTADSRLSDERNPLDNSVDMAALTHATAGDIIIYGALGVPTLLPKGADTEVLTLTSGLPAWEAAGGGVGSGTLIHEFSDSYFGTPYDNSGLCGVLWSCSSVSVAQTASTFTPSEAADFFVDWDFSIGNTCSGKPQRWRVCIDTTDDAVANWVTVQSGGSCLTNMNVGVIGDTLYGYSHVSGQREEALPANQIGYRIQYRNAGCGGTTYVRDLELDFVKINP
jgi:hypothetical protein